jgi:putative tryptophan/tyrosine transport system substrate-binding protein
MRLQTVGLVATLALTLLVAPLAADAQPPTKVHRIGRLSVGGGPSAGHGPSMKAFQQGLRDLGYLEGQNIVIENRFAEGREERLPDLAAELVRLQVEVIVALGVATSAVKQATSTIPIVTITRDPVEEGFVASLAHPGGNITGLSLLMTELDGKRLEFLKETVPNIARLAVLANPAAPRHEPVVQDLTVAGRALGVELQVLELRSPDEFESAFAAIHRAGAGALLVLADQYVFERHVSDITALALQNRLPAMYPWRMYVDAGGLISYGPSLAEMHRRAATYVDKILKGAKPSALPVEQPTTFELVINLKTAKALGLTMPQSLLLLADEVIQ